MLAVSWPDSLSLHHVSWPGKKRASSFLSNYLSVQLLSLLLIITFDEKSMCTINVAVHLCFVINNNLIIISIMVIMVTCSFSSCWLLVTKEALASLLLKPITRLVILSTSSVNSRTCKKFLVIILLFSRSMSPYRSPSVEQACQLLGQSLCHPEQNRGQFV